MRSGITVVTAFVCCLLTIVIVMTIGSYSLQKDEIERAVTFCAEQTAKQCIEQNIENKDEIKTLATNLFSSQINSKKGTLHLYILYVDKDIVDIAASFYYTQYNGTEKRISCRKTFLKDWEDGKEEESVLRFISKKYVNETPEEGGLKENSIWKNNEVLSFIFANVMHNDGSWENCEDVIELKR